MISESGSTVVSFYSQDNLVIRHQNRHMCESNIPNDAKQTGLLRKGALFFKGWNLGNYRNRTLKKGTPSMGFILAQ